MPEKKKKQKAPKGTVKKLLRFLRPYRGRLLLSLLCSAVNAGLSLYIPLLFGRCIDLITGAGQVDTEGVKQKLIFSAGLILVILDQLFKLGILLFLDHESNLPP